MRASVRERQAILERRVPQVWPKGRRFRILSVDGGGIRGIFPAAVLAGLETRYTGGRSISSYFDLVAGTSTGGIIALGLGADLTASDMLNLYERRGCEVFPPYPDSRVGRTRAWLADKVQLARYRYDRAALRAMLYGVLGRRKFGDSKLRLCIPSFDGKHGSVYIYKTPHDPVYKTDLHEAMINVALATAAAPTYFQPFEHRRYTLVDGGVWANNPTMIAVLEALLCFDVDRSNIDVLSIGCGDERYAVSEAQKYSGGLWHWRTIINAAMSLQSVAAINQAKLLLGPSAVIRLDAPAYTPALRLDDWRRSVALLPPAAQAAIDNQGDSIAGRFLQSEAQPYEPISFDKGLD